MFSNRRHAIFVLLSSQPRFADPLFHERISVPDMNPPFHDDALYLIGAATSSGKGRADFYDEDDDTVHSFEDGVLTIDTDYADYRSYKLSLDGPVLTACLHLPGEGEGTRLALDDDDVEDLTDRLARMAGSMRAVAARDVAPVAQPWTALMTAMLGQDAATAATCAPGKGDDLATALQDVLARAGRSGEWEWKEFGETGVATLNHECKALADASIRIDYPAADEHQAIFNHRDFSGAILAWFDRQLSPHGWTLLALSPFDELQSFGLFKSGNVRDVRAMLKQLGIKTKAAPAYGN
jgi:hypothetical protein